MRCTNHVGVSEAKDHWLVNFKQTTRNIKCHGRAGCSTTFITVTVQQCRIKIGRLEDAVIGWIHLNKLPDKLNLYQEAEPS